MPVITGLSLKVLIYIFEKETFSKYIWKVSQNDGLESESTAKNIQPSCHLSEGVIHKNPWGPVFPPAHLRGYWLGQLTLPFLCALKFSKPSLWTLQNKIEEGEEKLEKKDVRGGERVGGLQDIYWYVTEVCGKGEIECFKRVLRPIYGFWNTQEKE